MYGRWTPLGSIYMAGRVSGGSGDGEVSRHRGYGQRREDDPYPWKMEVMASVNR